MHLYIFSASRYIALTAMSNFVQVVQKWLETNKFVRTTTHTGSKFSQISLGLLCTRGTVVVHLYCSSLWRQMAPQQTAKFRTARFRQFCVSLRNDSVTNYGSIWTQFSPSRVCTLCSKPFAQYMEYGKVDPSVSRKRLKILRSRLGYIITLRSRVVVQNLTKIC